MVANEFDRFSQAVAVLFESLGFSLTPGLVKGWWAVLAPKLSIEEFERATFRAMEGCTYQPKPADILRLAGREAMSIEDRALRAWGIANQAVYDIGHTRSVDFDDRVINATIRQLGGWERFCSIPDDEAQRFLSRQFAQTYCALARDASHLSEEATRRLSGSMENNCAPEHAHRLAANVYATITTGLPTLPGLPAPRPRPRLLSSESA